MEKEVGPNDALGLWYKKTSSFQSSLPFFLKNSSNSRNQSIMKLLSVVLVLSAVVASALAGCTISPAVKGTSTVVFTFSPTPTQVLAGLGLDDDKSPVALINLLQSFTNQATTVMNGIVGIAQRLLPFAPIPKCRYYWISNQLFCDNVNYALVSPICLAYGAITNATVPINIPLPTNPLVPLTCENDTVRPWGVDMIQAPAAWDMGWKGQGIVVANIDSGVRVSHVELKDNYRGGPYSWFDAYNLSPNTPTDVNGHGSHTMGTMVGKTVGVAPSATWMACRGCGPTGSCDNEQLLACGQFMACPDNKARNCTTRPNIINNSWGGGIGNTMYLQVLATWKALGIASFFSAGNAGGNGAPCGTVASPADSNYTVTGILSVGSTACNDAISSFSSTGPSQAADYMGGLAIQIVGPGTNVRSAWNTDDTAYNVISGTSMSSPAVAGGGAVLLSQRPNSTPAQLYKILMDTAYQRPEVTSSLTYCTSSNLNDPLAPWPNNVYGYGRINVFAACNYMQPN